MVPKASLNLYLLTGNHFSATHAGVFVEAPVFLFEQLKHLVHSLRLPHLELLGTSCCCSTASCRVPQSSAFEEQPIYFVLPFELDEEVSQVLKCYN